MADSKTDKDGFEEVYLMTVSGGIEMDIVEGILRYEKIPFVKKYPGFGGVAQALQVFFNEDIELYVSGEDLQRARDAVQKNGENAADHKTDTQ